MALQGKIIMDDVIYEKMYIRISKLRSEHADYEKFEIVDDPDNPKIAEKLTWVSRYENIVTYTVYSDIESRRNYATPLSTGTLNFDFDPNSALNIYSQAYNMLRKLFVEGEVEDV